MDVSVENPGGLARKLKVQIPAERVSEAVDAKVKRVGQHAKIPGFRPGKAPMKVLYQRYGAQARQEAAGELIQSVYPEAIEKAELNLFDTLKKYQDIDISVKHTTSNMTNLVSPMYAAVKTCTPDDKVQTSQSASAGPELENKYSQQQNSPLGPGFANFSNPYGLKSQDQKKQINSGQVKSAKPGADRPKSNISQSEIQSAWGNISYYQAAAAAAGGLRA